MSRVFEKNPRFEVRELDAEAIPQDFETFDCVIMVALVEHLLDPLEAMGRVRELLNPGGFVYIDTPNMAKITRRVKLAFGRFPATASRNEGLTTYEGQQVRLHDEGHLHYFTFRSLELMLTTRCGYSRTVRAPYFVDRWLPRRVGHALARLRPTLFSELAILVYA
jgi:SAM-dependent methyltransferase